MTIIGLSTWLTRRPPSPRVIPCANPSHPRLSTRKAPRLFKTTPPPPPSWKGSARSLAPDLLSPLSLVSHRFVSHLDLSTLDSHNLLLSLALTRRALSHNCPTQRHPHHGVPATASTTSVPHRSRPFRPSRLAPPLPSPLRQARAVLALFTHPALIPGLAIDVAGHPQPAP